MPDKKITEGKSMSDTNDDKLLVPDRKGMEFEYDFGPSEFKAEVADPEMDAVLDDIFDEADKALAKTQIDDPKNWEYDFSDASFTGEIASPHINSLSDDLIKQAFPNGKEAYQKERQRTGKKREE